MKIKFNIPGKVIEKLNRLNELCSFDGFDIYLGGGAIRDLYSGRGSSEIKDYDIFCVPNSKNRSVDFSRAPQSKLMFGNMITEMKKRGVSCVVWIFDNNTEYNLIIYNKSMTPEQVASDMDMGICQAMYHIYSGEVFASEHFVNDHADKIIRCYHKYGKRRMKDRYARMKKKYPDYTKKGEPFFAFKSRKQTRAYSRSSNY